MAFVPIAIHYWTTHKPAETQQSKTASTDADQPQEAHGTDTAPDNTPTEAKTNNARQGPGLAGIAGRLVVLGLASPFLQLQTGASGVIGLIILLVGMRFAWRMTRGVQITIDGPYGSPAKA